MAIKLLQELIETFPQADPESEFYNEEINGCEAVNVLTGFIPRVRMCLDNGQRASESLEIIKACWNFIENVTNEDPERNDKFFALRERMRNILWERQDEPPIVAIILEGGLVQCIVSNQPGNIPPMNVMVLDYDIEGADEDELLWVRRKEGSVSIVTGCYLGIEQADIDLAAVMDQLDKRGW